MTLPSKVCRRIGKLPDGSVLVAELYAALKDSDGEVVESQIGRRVPGDFKAIAVMERRKGWDDQYPEELKVGDWEFEVFSTSGENLGKDTSGCRECHHPLTDTEFMFSIEPSCRGRIEPPPARHTVIVTGAFPH